MYQIPFQEKTYRPGDDVIPGNSTDLTPVELVLVPAAGPDLARLKSMIFANVALIGDDNTPATQDALIAAFAHAGAVFVNTVESVRGLTVPAALAAKVGLIAAAQIPTKDDPNQPGRRLADREAPIRVITGGDFSKVVPYFPLLSFKVAWEILNISNQVQGQDPRFFDLRSGSGGAGTRRRKPSTAGSARKTKGGPATAASQTSTGSQPAGT